MFDYIPLESYTNFQYYVLLLIALLILINAMVYDIYNENSISFFNYFGWLFVVVFTIYMGLRPISGTYFGDTANYAQAYELLQNGKSVTIEKDYMFNYFMAFCSKIMSVQSFFLLLDFLYVIPYVLFCKKFFGKYWFYAFFMFIGSFLFWASGVNGLRNGLGTSFFLLGLFFYEKKWAMYICFLLSFFMHASLVITIAAFITSGIYKNPKIYLYIWLAAIPLSLIGGSFWTNFFASLGFEDRTAGYLTNSEENMSQFSKTGFRWDFLLYSTTAISAGWYFIFKKQILDQFYIQVFGIYCIANAFWILVITAAFSNRFAYLSWFLMPVIIAYPMFRYKIWKDQYKTSAIIMFLYFMFTFVMNVK